MGLNFATDLADTMPLRDAIGIHLRNNHYPPVPLSMVTPCIRAIEACIERDWERLIELPDGIKWRNQITAPANAIAEAHHLGPWIDLEPWEIEE